ncbi:GntR family transcriptional regulator, partial [Lactobacillus parabuchneri]|nr:GntR family transcriptional regulator [Lentilactobacillus parabuchneri]
MVWYDSIKQFKNQPFLSCSMSVLSWIFLPGEKIQDKTLMEQLNISRTPIREAILR